VLATLAAIVVWRQSDSDTEYQKLIRCERWEVVPQFVFAPLRVSADYPGSGVGLLK
jgi:hypothetical protein